MQDQTQEIQEQQQIQQEIEQQQENQPEQQQEVKQEEQNLNENLEQKQENEEEKVQEVIENNEQEQKEEQIPEEQPQQQVQEEVKEEQPEEQKEQQQPEQQEQMNELQDVQEEKQEEVQQEQPKEEMKEEIKEEVKEEKQEEHIEQPEQQEIKEEQNEKPQVQEKIEEKQEEKPEEQQEEKKEENIEEKKEQIVEEQQEKVEEKLVNYEQQDRDFYFNKKQDPQLKTELYTATIIGDSSTGKTCILKRLFQNQFDEQVKSTTAIDNLKCVFQQENKNIDFTIYDTAGQEQFKSISTSIIKKSNFVFVCMDENLDIKSRDTWIDFVKTCNQDCDIYTVVNKCDLIDNNKLQKLQEEHKDWIFVSAKTGDRILQLIQRINFVQKDKDFTKKLDINVEQDKGKCC